MDRSAPRLDTLDGISIASRVGRVWRVLSTAGLMQGISTSDTLPGTDNNQDYRHLDLLIIVDSWVADPRGNDVTASVGCCAVFTR